MGFLKLLRAIAGVYLAVAALLFLGQTWLLFPTAMVQSPVTALPASASMLELETAGGEMLHGVQIPAAQPPEGERVTLLGFGGNAWNAESVAVYLHQLFPSADVVAFHYRGYQPSTGRPSAAALLEDALVVHDHVTTSLASTRIVAVGLSIGTGVAAFLASRRPLSGLILVSPFDSLQDLASEHYPWLPVRWLLRHRIPAASFLREQRSPTAVIAAADDRVVPPRRTEMARRAIPNLVFDRTIERVDHNGLYGHAAFRIAIQEALLRIENAR